MDAVSRRGDLVMRQVVPTLSFVLRRCCGDDERARGLLVDRSCVWRWVQDYAPEINKRGRPHLKPANRSWRVDETYLKVKGKDRYLYRAVDSRCQSIDFLLPARRESAVANRFIP